MRLSVAPDLDSIVAFRRRDRDVAGIEVALDEPELPPRRRAVAAAAAGLDADQVAGCELEGILLVDALECFRSGLAQHEAAGLGIRSALHAPGRTQGAVEIGLQIAGRKDSIGLAESHSAPERAGSA